MAAQKMKCANCGKKVMHYDDRTVESHIMPGKNIYCPRKTY